MIDPYTKLHHELIEPLIKLDLTGRQFRIILWIARHTYGMMGAKFAGYSWRKIAADINTDRAGVSRAGRELIDNGFLSLNDAGEIGINKNKIRSFGPCPLTQVSINTGCLDDAKGVSINTPPILIIKKKESVHHAPDALNAQFLTFWDAYPKKKAKKDALKAWSKISPDAELFDKIILAIEANKKHESWKEYKFIPFPASWLNAARWEDELGETNGKNNTNIWA